MTEKKKDPVKIASREAPKIRPVDDNNKPLSEARTAPKTVSFDKARKAPSNKKYYPKTDDD